MKKPTPLSRRWTCVVGTGLVRTTIDPWISEAWQRKFGGQVPFGDLRNQWRKQHCRTLNPYGSEDCPYRPDQCASAYASAIKKTIGASPGKPVGYFRKVAIVDAARRADEGVDIRLREQYRGRTNVPSAEAPPPQRSGYAGDETEDFRKGQGMRSTSDRPTGIGALLGSLDLRPRQLHGDEGEEGAE